MEHLLIFGTGILAVLARSTGGFQHVPAASLPPSGRLAGCCPKPTKTQWLFSSHLLPVSRSGLNGRSVPVSGRLAAKSGLLGPERQEGADQRLFNRQISTPHKIWKAVVEKSQPERNAQVSMPREDVVDQAHRLFDHVVLRDRAVLREGKAGLPARNSIDL